MKNIFDSKDVSEIMNRIEMLKPESKAQWGKMNAGQMLAHCNVTYEMAYENKHPKSNAVKKFLMKTFVKPIVVSKKPYKKNNRTAPEFLITDPKDFDEEKQRLIGYIAKTQELGPSYFQDKESHSFGVLSIQEWNNMFSKHLDHHLEQFGV